jgi:hypothetical protein
LRFHCRCDTHKWKRRVELKRCSCRRGQKRR